MGWVVGLDFLKIAQFNFTVFVTQIFLLDNGVSCLFERFSHWTFENYIFHQIFILSKGFEERSGLPVQKGRKFKLEIKVLPDRFQV